MAEAKIQFTPAQAAAIQARGGSLLVSAAAGSGKTRVLVERVAGLITDPDHPVDADSLLIMTFTNAAAAKLRADITKRLAAEIRQHPQDVRLRRQQMRLQRASIGTVDAFCLHFVQQNFSALDVPPDFTIADDATLVRLQQETLSAVLEQAYTILTSVPLRTCMTAAGRMIPQAGRCRNCITLPRRCHTRRRRCSALLKCGRAMPHRKRPSGGRPFCGKPLHGSRAYCAFCARRKKLQRRTRRRIKP